jgi:hypothetical protein
MTIHETFNFIREKLFKNSELTEGSTYGGMHCPDLTWIADKALWEQGNNSITLTVAIDTDDYYHLNITIDKMVKHIHKENE